MNPCHELSPFEQLPLLAIGNILAQFPVVIGSKNIANRADVPVIIRNAGSLVCTSKTMRIKINSQETQSIFYRSLAQKFGGTPPSFAARWDSLGSRAWLWEYIEKSGYLQLYKTIQSILSATNTYLKNPNSFIELDHRIFGINIKKGMALYINYITHNCATICLATPLGIRIIGNAFDPKGITPYLSSNNTTLKISFSPNLELAETNKKITNLKRCLAFSIREVNGEKIEDAIADHEQGKYMDRLKDKIWGMLRANELGIDPLAAKASDNIKNKIKETEPPFTKFEEIPRWAIQKMERMKGNTRTPEDLPTIEKQILKSLSYLSAFYECNSWYIEYNEWRNTFYLKENKNDCTPKELEIAYQLVMNLLSHNWSRAELSEYLFLPKMKSEEHYQLLVRKEHSKHFHYIYLFKNLIEILYNKKEIYFNYYQYESNCVYYLWIRKKNFDQIVKALNISLPISQIKDH